MKPREKAIDLYNKFRNELPVLSGNKKAKKMAILCVNEILQTNRLIDDEFAIQGTYHVDYWLDVKDELINL